MAGNMGPIGVAAHSEKYGSRKYVLSSAASLWSRARWKSPKCAIAVKNTN